MRVSVSRPNSRRQDYEVVLCNMRDELLRSLGAGGDTVADAGPMAEDDLAQVSHDQFVSLHLNCLDRDHLRKIEEALARLRKGGYGICQECGKRIPAKRLRAVPWSSYCIKCQEELSAFANVPAEEIQSE